jgi:hypothetical protein
MRSRKAAIDKSKGIAEASLAPDGTSFKRERPAPSTSSHGRGSIASRAFSMAADRKVSVSRARLKPLKSIPTPEPPHDSNRHMHGTPRDDTARSRPPTTPKEGAGASSSAPEPAKASKTFEYETQDSDVVCFELLAADDLGIHAPVMTNDFTGQLHWTGLATT